MNEENASRARELAHARHEIGNALSIVRASVEAMADGVLEPTPDRLNRLLDALAAASALLDELSFPD